MDPTPVCCPHLVCPARGHVGQGNLGVPSHKEPWCRCTPCHTTFSATTGTALSRLRTPAETVTLVLPLRAPGCPLQAMVVACGGDARTGAAWMRRGGVSSVTRSMRL